jgi:hypothetical protein
MDDSKKQTFIIKKLQKNVIRKQFNLDRKVINIISK